MARDVVRDWMWSEACEMLTRAAEYGNNRIILGAHYAMDVLGGRTVATYDLAQLLGRVRSGGPATGARSDRRLRLAREAPADQLRLERRVGETLHGAFQDDAGGLGVLHIGDLVDLPGSLAVPAGALVRVGDGLPRHLAELAAHGAQERLLGGDVGQPGLEAVDAGLEARELGAHVEPLAERRCHVGEDRPRSQPRQHLERLLAGFLGAAEPDEQVGQSGAHVDQLALQVGDELIEIRGTRIQMEPKADEWSAGDPDVDVPRRRGSLRGSHSAIIAGL